MRLTINKDTMMLIKILNKDDFVKIEKLKKKFKIFRVLLVQNNSKIQAVEFFNKDGVFRGFGTNINEAFKKANKSLTRYYKKKG